MSRKKWSPSAKFEIALLALKGETTINEICTRYQVSPCQVHAWKKQLLEQGAQLFSKSDKVADTAHKLEREQSKLFEKIGQLTIERDFLKKAWGKFQENSDDS
ncbi:MAG: transposase [Gammaproteobacteria bacterium]|nr:transposase [Gammaproteobacteria bacterium]